MARIKKYSPEQKLSSFQTFILDENPNSDYFRITEFKDTFTGGKNGFLIEGSEYLKESTEIKIELLDVNGDPIYYEPGNGIPEYYEGISKLIAVYVYNDTPIGLGNITILGELKEYDDNGVKREVPDEWKGAYNVKWQRTFQVNKNLANEDKVRFYRRPKVAIDEIVKPIFSKTPNLITQSGSIDGTPLVPNAGSRLSNFSLPTSYRIRTNDNTYWTGSVVGQTLSVPSLGYTPTITDVVSKTELVVDPPYAPNDIVSSFSAEDYSVDFVYIEGVGDLATALTGSFAKIKITDMNTFVGDAARVKVFRRSQSQLSDYEFTQEIQLESNEVLRDIETVSTNEVNYGQFTENVFNQYWITSSNDLAIQLNQDFLYNSIEFDSTGTNSFFTSQSFDISSGVEYTLTFNVRKTSNSNGDDYIKAFLGSTPGPIVEDTSGAIACSTAASYSGGESYPTEQSVNLGENTGNTNFQFTAQTVPDRFIVEWDGNVVIDSGYRGGSEYDFGGASRSSFTNALTGETDPITGNTYPDLTTYPDDGYPRITTAPLPLQPGSGSADFNKTSSSPQLATVKVYAPQAGTAWDFTLNCPQDPPITGIERISNPTTTQTITTVQSSNSVLQKTPIEVNFVADSIDDVRLYFEVIGSDWYISDVSLKASQETSFSPDVITFIQQVPKTLPSETFDYRFEFYDINNNYIPVLVEETKTFDGGNLNLFEKSIELVPDQLYFAFDSASNPLPPTVINFEVNTTLVTGSVTFTSESYDFFGDFISASEYAGGGQYPGLLNDVNTDEPFLTVTNFTGSLLPDSRKVQFIKYTAEVEGVSDSVIITRVQDGQGGVNFEIRPFRGTIIKNKSDNDIELQALRIDGVNEIVLKDNLPQDGFSDAKLRILSGSTYYLLSDAVDNNIIKGVSAGLTGSGEIDYNARFNRDAIDGELTVFLMDGDTETDILTSLKLTDLLDGLGSGFINFSAEQFSLQPRLDTSYNPITASVTASFQERGKENSFISGCLMVTPSASIDEDYVTHYYMFYETGAFDRRVTVNATDLLDNPVYSGIPGQSINFYSALETKQLTLNFTYLEDITSASVSVDKTFYIVPEGKPGDDAIVIDIDPKIIQLSSNQKGEIYTYKPMDTEIGIKQGRLDLLFSDSATAGTFDITNVTTFGIGTGSISSYNEYSASITDFDGMPRNVLSGSIKYDLQIHPYFTSSFFTQSVIQKITKAVDGADAIDVLINPIAVNFSGDETGVVIDTAAADTTINVKQGDEYLLFSSSAEPGTFTASFTTRNINILNISASNDYASLNGNDTINFTNFGQMEYTTASVVYDITAYPYSLANGITGSSQRFRRTQIFSKANAGAVARSVKLTASTTTVNYDGDGTQIAPEGPVILTANAFGLTGSAYFQFLLDGFAYTLIDTDDQFELGSGDTPPPGEIATWTVTLRDGSPDAGVVAQDSITIAGIKSGGDGFTVELENNNVSVPFEVDGTGDFSGTGTVIRAFKSNTELTHVSSYSAQSVDPLGDPIGTLGEFSSSLYSISPWINQTNIPTGNPATVGPISSWTDPISNTQAEIVFKVDVENGRAVFFKTQSLAVSFEGAVGPGIVFRGEYTGSIDYLYSIAAGRRDAVIYDKDGDGIAETYYIILQENGPDSTVADPTNTSYWEELGTEDLFVAAEIGIFGESFVKSTLNVGMPPPDNQNANIAIVGGTDEPYIAIGQTGIQGYGQQGVFVGLTNDGGPNGTSGTFGIMSLVGDSTAPSYNGLFWDGEVLTIRGAIRQTEAGVPEGTTRGVWTAGETYYPNDIVTYSGQTYIMINTIPIVATNNSSVNTGYPPSATNSWDVFSASGTSGTNGSSGSSGSGGTSGTGGTSGAQGSDGAPGEPGAGVVYRGIYDATKAYFHTTQRRDVVRGSDGNYYLVNNTGKNGLTTWGDPTSSSDWTAFGAQFSSVATDILLAQDVYADRTINVGADAAGSASIALNADYVNGNANPFISIGQTTQDFLTNGIYFGYKGGNPVLSMVSGSTFFFYESGSIELSDASFVGSGSIIEGSSIRVGRNLDVSVTASNAYNFTVSSEGVVSASQAYIEGTIAASAGNIGNWVIDPIVNGEGGALRDSDSEIVFEPNIPEIQIFDSGNQKVKIGSLPELSSIEPLGDVASWGSGQPTISSFDHTTPIPNQFGFSSVSNTVYSAVTETTGISVSAGSYLIKSGSWKQLTIEDTGDLDYTTAGSNSNPNYSPSYAGQIHGGFYVAYNGQRSRQVSYVLQAVDKDNGDAVLGTYTIGSAFLRGNSPQQSRYVAVDSGGGAVIESVTGNTEITLWDGTTKLAKDCKIDDMILAWSHIDNKWVSANISKIYKRNVTEIYKVTAGGYEVEVSDTHGFWLFGNEENSGKVTVNNIQKGITKIWIKDGDTKKEVIVDNVEKIEKEEEVITFTIPNYVNYISNNIISHNVITGTLFWSLQVTDEGYTAASGNATIAGSNDTELAITLNSSTSNLGFRYRLVVTSNGAPVANVASDGSVTWTNNSTQTFFDQTDDGSSDIYFSGTPLNNDDPIVERQNNFVEIQPGGVQVVTSQDIFVRARRRNNLTPANAADAFIFFANGGTSTFSSLGSNPYLTAIAVDGDVIPFNETGTGPHDLGANTTDGKWNVVWTNALNSLDTTNLGVSKTDSITGTTGVTTASTKRSYVKLPGGVICQWGSINDSSNPKTVTFPTQFPNSVSSVVCSTIRNSDGAGGYNHVYNIDRSGCDLILDGQYGFWMAWGH